MSDSTDEEIAILQARSDLAVQNRNYWQAEAERQADLIKKLEAELASCRDCRDKIDCLSRGSSNRQTLSNRPPEYGGES